MRVAIAAAFFTPSALSGRAVVLGVVHHPCQSKADDRQNVDQIAEGPFHGLVPPERSPTGWPSKFWREAAREIRILTGVTESFDGIVMVMRRAGHVQDLSTAS